MTTYEKQKKLMDDMTNLCIEKIRKDACNSLFNSAFETQYPSKCFIPGVIAPIYVKWRWLDRILIKIFKPFKKIT